MISRAFVFEAATTPSSFNPVDRRPDGDGQRTVRLAAILFDMWNGCENRVIGAKVADRPDRYGGLIRGGQAVEIHFENLDNFVYRTPPNSVGQHRLAYQESCCGLEPVALTGWPNDAAIPGWVVVGDEHKECYSPVDVEVELAEPNLTHNSIFRLTLMSYSLYEFDLAPLMGKQTILDEWSMFQSMEYSAGDVVPYIIEGSDAFGALVLQERLDELRYLAQLHSARPITSSVVGQSLSMHTATTRNGPFVPLAGRHRSRDPEPTRFTATSSVGRVVRLC